MPLGRERTRRLRGTARRRGRPHRYTWIRWTVGVGATLGIAGVALSGLLRFDLWSGEHRVLFEPADVVTAAKAFAFPFLAINVLIVLASRFVGRYLCGFVCPVGSLARFSEWIGWRRGGATRRRLGRVAVFAACLAIAGTALAFWVDRRVFTAGSPGAVAVTGGALGATAFTLFLVIDRLGLRFCRDVCPSGVYFAVLGPESGAGVEFAHPETCVDCGACEAVCPVDLSPREATAPTALPGHGFYPEGLPAPAVCLRCGDCVAVCEDATKKGEELTPLVLGTGRAGAHADEGEHA